MYFDIGSFVKSAPRDIKNLLPKGHLEVLHGMKVNFLESYGTVTQYEVDGESFYLYPVYKEWCISEKQMELSFL